MHFVTIVDGLVRRLLGQPANLTQQQAMEPRPQSLPSLPKLHAAGHKGTKRRRLETRPLVPRSGGLST